MKRSGERLRAAKVDNHGSDSRIFAGFQEIFTFVEATGPADPVYVLITQGLFSNAVLTSLVGLF